MMGVAERRQRDRAARKHAILEAAAEVFGREGYADTAMEIIAERTGVNIATVYYYYASKEMLYLAVLAAAMENVLPDLVRAVADGASVRDKLRSIAFTYAAFHDRHPDLLLVARCLGSDGQGDESDTRELAHHALAAVRRALDITAGVLVEGHGRGELRSVDPRRTVMLMWAAFTGVLQASSILRLDERDEVIQQWLDLTIQGLARY